MLLLAELAELTPAELVAVTVNVYEVEPLNPVTEIGELLPLAVIPPGELVAL
jgi:hypothetical protein